jgi:hypothetical protein
MKGESNFNVRTLAISCHAQEELTQAVYTIINRMAALLGDISFGDLFTTPFAELVPRLIQNIDAAPDQFRDPDRVQSNHMALARYAGNFSFITLYEGGFTAVPADVRHILIKLFQLDGIRWPILTRFDPPGQLIAGIQRLVELAGDLTYRDIFELAYDDPAVNPDVIDGIKAGIAVGCLFIAPNNCKKASDGCQFQPGSYCSNAKSSDGPCLVAVAVAN